MSQQQHGTSNGGSSHQHHSSRGSSSHHRSHGGATLSSAAGGDAVHKSGGSLTSQQQQQQQAHASRPPHAQQQQQPSSHRQPSSSSSSHHHKQPKQQEEDAQPKLRKYEDLPLAKKGGPFLMFHGLTNTRTNFTSALPEPPLDSKQLLIPETMNLEQHTKYKYGALERSRKRALQTDASMGIDLGLVDPRQYTRGKLYNDDVRFRLSFGSGDRAASSSAASAAAASMHEIDRALLRDEREEAEEKEREERKRSLNREATWLMKREYMARGQTTLYGGQVKKSAAGVARESLQADSDEEDESEAIDSTAMSADQVYEYVNKQFDRARELDLLEFRHHDPKKQHLKPVSVVPIFPDVKLWTNMYSLVTFDANPIPPSMYPDHPVSGKPYNRCTHHEQREIRKHMQANQLVNAALMSESRTQDLLQLSEQERAQGKATHIIDYMLPKDKAVANDPSKSGCAAPTLQVGDSGTQEYQHVREYRMSIMSYHFDDSYALQFDDKNGVVTYCRIRNKIAVSKRKEHSDDSTNARYRRLEEQKQRQDLFVSRGSQASSNLALLRDLEPIESTLAEEEEEDAGADADEAEADQPAQPPAKRARYD